MTRIIRVFLLYRLTTTRHQNARATVLVKRKTVCELLGLLISHSTSSNTVAQTLDRIEGTSEYECRVITPISF